MTAALSNGILFFRVWGWCHEKFGTRLAFRTTFLESCGASFTVWYDLQVFVVNLSLVLVIWIISNPSVQLCGWVRTTCRKLNTTELWQRNQICVISQIVPNFCHGMFFGHACCLMIIAAKGKVWSLNTFLTKFDYYGRSTRMWMMISYLKQMREKHFKTWNAKVKRLGSNKWPGFRFCKH